jgi:hypothetical protein
MNPSEQDRASQLGRLWDNLTPGETASSTDAELLADIQFVREVTAVPLPPPALAAQIWQHVGNQDLTAMVSTTVVFASPNGVAHRPKPEATPIHQEQQPNTLPAEHRRHMLDLAGLYRLLAIGVLAGFVAGLVASSWTRLAMRLAGFLTVDQNRGLLTTAEAVVGEITFGGTLFLGIFGGVVGIAGGLLYITIRGWLPTHPMIRAVAYGVLLFVVFGFVVMDEHNPDYQRFGPAWLNVCTFSLTYVIYGVIASLVAERLIAQVPRWTLHRTEGRLARLVSLALTPFGAIGLLAIPIILVTGLGNPASAIIAAIFLLFAIPRVIQLPAWNPGAHFPAWRRVSALAILVPGLVGVFLTIQGVAGILAG